jgi:hypothetical protein
MVAGGGEQKWTALMRKAMVRTKQREIRMRIAGAMTLAGTGFFAFALCAGAAYGQDRPKSLREVLEGYPGWQAMPVQRFPQIQQIPQTPQTPKKTVLRDETGGRIDDHWLRFQLLAQSGDDVEIRGLCGSACTLITAHIPKERLCVGKGARLAFHQARHVDGRPDPAGTQWILDRYPAPIKAWLESRELPLGGTNKFLILWAPDLWGMGYRRCAD